MTNVWLVVKKKKKKMSIYSYEFVSISAHIAQLADVSSAERLQFLGSFGTFFLG